MSNGSKGILEGLNINSKKDKNVNSQEVKNLGIEELSVKRSYSLKPSTVKKLQEMKIFIYDDPNVTFNEIVDEAICFLYENKKEK
ncbi:hypothetical protein [Tepidibacter formicigenes]|jgi:ABC-type Zn2+ transport system substrate-binding protein/surface adhesin|uniref:Uncharacterized protein n=1 Tax=Tepidibacter formicigenes DSM 15518 TaxID=1123349 RepID=A0A1M6UEL3_9FIRM|nr:hypothetical protein [Tepidibacter formicigenes]SHK67619.1 hypothetical protein SAMN02744037_02786 [Tepidibacter formicigenes DSM 15518]